VISSANAAALIAAGLLSVVFFPAGALTLLRRHPSEGAPMDTVPAAPADAPVHAM
jgi:hypothetical protein